MPEKNSSEAESDQLGLGNDQRKFGLPFDGCTDEEIKRITQGVVDEYSLNDHAHLFEKAARVLANPDPKHWEELMPELSTQEVNALKNERQLSFWDQPWPLRATFLMLFVAAIVQGWSQTVTSGAKLLLPDSFGWSSAVIGNELSYLATEPANIVGQSGQSYALKSSSTIMFSALNAAPYLVAACSCWFSDALNDLSLGRRGAISLSAFLILMSAIGAASANRYWDLFLFRAMLGLGLGWNAVVVPVFAAEIAPAHSRGALVMNWQIFNAVGILLGFIANITISEAVFGSWRWQAASLCIPSAALFWFTRFICWESPRFLMKTDRLRKSRYERSTRRLQAKYQEQWISYDELIRDETIPARLGPITIPPSLYNSWLLPSFAWRFIRPSINPPYKYGPPAFQTLVSLRGEPILAAKELLLVHCRLLSENQENFTRYSTIDRSQYVDASQNLNFSLFTRIGHLFASSKSRFGHIRRAAIAAVCLMLSQQLCGMNVFLFYWEILFRTPEASLSLSPATISCIIAFANLIFSLPAYKLIESQGRQWLLLATLPLLAIIMAIAAVSKTVFQGDSGVQQDQVVFALVFAFVAAHSFGFGPVPFTYSAEIFPLEHRMVGMSLAISTNMLGAGAVASLAPWIGNSWSVLGIFACFNLLAFLGVWWLVPEIGGPIVNGTRSYGSAMDLEELNYIFRLPNRAHRAYQFNVYRTYFWRSIRNLLLFRKQPPPCVSFYEWSEAPENSSSVKRSLQGSVHMNSSPPADTSRVPPETTDAQVTSRFTCACKKVIEDTYNEYLPGAVDALLQQFNANQRPNQSAHSHAGTTYQQCRGSLAERVRTVVITLSSLLSPFRTGRRDDRDPARPPSIGNEIEKGGSGEDQYLFVCITQKKKYCRTKMVPLRMDFGCDDDFFRTLRRLFQNTSGRWRRALGFKCLSEIRFVKFRISAHSFVEIHSHSGMRDRAQEPFPPSTHPDYHYQPRPMLVSPAVGHNLMMHFYECPSACAQTDFCLRRLPKHSTGVIDVDEDTQEAFAWGIELVEGPDWAFFWVLGFFIVIMSAVFGAVWACIRHSIQDGFAIAGYMITVFAFLGWCGAACI